MSDNFPRNITLTPFQQEDEQWMLTHPRNMILYDKGLGKTVLAIKRNIDLQIGTSLVACPTSAFKTWKDHAFDMFTQYAPTTDVDVFFIRGSADFRQKYWDELKQPERTRQHRLFICSHDAFRRDIMGLSNLQRKHIDQCDVDEAHKMRNRKSAMYKTFKPLSRQVRHFSFLSGTPISRGAQEFFTYLNCIDPNYFSSYHRYMSVFYDMAVGTYGAEIIGPKNTQEFYRLMNMHARARRKSDPFISAQMPPKTRTPLFTQLTKEQRRLYDDLKADGWTFKQKEGGIIIASGSLELQLRLRQLLVCPQILDPDSSDMGGAFYAFLDQLDTPGSDDSHTVIFTPFKRAFDPFRKALQAEGYHVNQISGGIALEEQEAQINDWQEKRGILLCTIAYAESFTLPVPNCYFIGYEWDPNMNEQAEDRLHRWTTKWPVNSYYFRYEDTVDDTLCGIVNFKTSQTEGFFTGFREYQAANTHLTII